MSTGASFSGLAMPVFTAFGWAGQETAINYALEQLELFARSLHGSLTREGLFYFPYAGLSRMHNSAYLAAEEAFMEDVYISFLARPMSLELQLALTDKKKLARTLKNCEAQPVQIHRLITELGGDWSLHVQQMQIDDESGEIAHYQDLFKDNVTKLLPEVSVELFSKAAYLNGEDKWVTPFYLSRRFSSEQVSVMGTAVLQVMDEQISALLPLIKFLTGKKVTRKRAAPKKTKKGVSAGSLAADTDTSTSIADEEGFTYTARLKPLHLRKGFINMTSDHWPFFSVNSRTEIRPVTVYYDGLYDKNSAVWRLQPNDMARLVLSPTVHSWLEEHCEIQDQVHLTVTRLSDEEIQISLRLVA
jgi:hypothetical protein